MTRDDAHIGRLLRDAAPQALAAIARRFGDFAAAEDAVQEALVAAVVQWPLDGVPDNPRGWLIAAAHRRYVDALRGDVARREREALVAADAPAFADDDAPDPDDALALVFLCCHPALTTSSAIALTLRAVAGLTTGEIASAFLVPEATIGQRISRAKQTIRDSGIAFEMPGDVERAQRLGAVLHVVYLVFNEGYVTSGGATLHRTDLSDEAIRLARQLRALLPRSGDVAGLLALMLLTDARRNARTGPSGELVPLDEQDRSRWNRELVAEGVALADAALALGAVGEYQLLAAIAAVHDEAPSAQATDWKQIAALYAMLLRLTDNPLVALNHAVAVAMVDGPTAGLALLDALNDEPRLQHGHRLNAVRAHLVERAGDAARAAVLYRQAAAKTASLPERDYLIGKAARLAR